MLRLQSKVRVAGLTGAEVTRFFLECNDAAYRAWWPGVHLRLHPVAAGGADHLGETVLMDEFVGSRHLRMRGVVTRVQPGRKIVWQMKKGVRLPAWLTLDLDDDDGGVTIVHTLTAGWTGPGRVLDPLLRRYLTADFAAALDRHVHTEFPRLRDLLHPGPHPGADDRSVP
ncbi:SRPBCC family protein [Mycolicibacterium palauense]|uniref:SRPBCC family protein n=1 Tax=Mycolicibacterium palauense TaxID=2034511 RepID=UPI001C3F2F36|nr:SRPBCC family protein [Mycolicibacterium palauense]